MRKEQSQFKRARWRKRDQWLLEEDVGKGSGEGLFKMQVSFSFAFHRRFYIVNYFSSETWVLPISTFLAMVVYAIVAIIFYNRDAWIPSFTCLTYSIFNWKSDTFKCIYAQNTIICVMCLMLMLINDHFGGPSVHCGQILQKNPGKGQSSPPLSGNASILGAYDPPPPP